VGVAFKCGGMTVGVASHYGLGNSDIKSRCRRDFPLSSRPAPRHRALCTARTGSFPRGKAAGRGLNHAPFCAEVKERVELYLSTLSVPSWPIIW